MKTTAYAVFATGGLYCVAPCNAELLKSHSTNRIAARLALLTKPDLIFLVFSRLRASLSLPLWPLLWYGVNMYEVVVVCQYVTIYDLVRLVLCDDLDMAVYASTFARMPLCIRCN